MLSSQGPQIWAPVSLARIWRYLVKFRVRLCLCAGAPAVEPCSHGGCVPSKATVTQAGMASQLCRRLAVFPFITNKGQYFEAM